MIYSRVHKTNTQLYYTLGLIAFQILFHFQNNKILVINKLKSFVDIYTVVTGNGVYNFRISTKVVELFRRNVFKNNNTPLESNKTIHIFYYFLNI